VPTWKAAIIAQPEKMSAGEFQRRGPAISELELGKGKRLSSIKSLIEDLNEDD
jgi:hypothetical protein